MALQILLTALLLLGTSYGAVCVENNTPLKLGKFGDMCVGMIVIFSIPIAILSALVLIWTWL